MKDINRYREKLYANVPAELYSRLEDFRSKYPYKSLQYGGLEWRYILTDKGSGVVLLLPGSTATGESNWREIPRLAQEFRVLSMSIPPVKSLEALLAGILNVLDTEEIDRMHVFGASMGGAIAHWLIRKYPQRINKLILLSIGMPDKKTAKALKTAIFTFSLFPWFVIKRMFEHEAERLVSVLPPDEATLMTAYFRDLYKNDMNKRTILGHFRIVADIANKVTFLGLDRPFTGKNPILIINAEDDETFSEEARNAFVDTYPNANTYLFPSGGHTLFSRRTELNRIIDEFLKHGEK